MLSALYNARILNKTMTTKTILDESAARGGGGGGEGGFQYKNARMCGYPTFGI